MPKHEAGEDESVSKKRSRKIENQLTSSTNGCLRCRLTETRCDRKDHGCTACARAKAECLAFPLIANDTLFGLPSSNLKKTNTTNTPGLKQHSVDWKLLMCSNEFLAETTPVGRMWSPEDVNSVNGNPDRQQIEQAELSKLLGQPLMKALEDHPAQGSDDQGGRLPLPSSELLRCIGLNIAKSEAGKAPLEGPNGKDISFSEHMGGSSLLALGVLLQEYSSFLL
ncbi:hypothetical protein LPJ59_001501 [Coemansia sp. RSA 2399]|nr:hypothetical protein LPJ59_001501 [Coemansia sp. RSA 2399]KAJ1906669.1 hypothetical protein LPJ81_001230 [Coemansia sp. IMI 209127]